MTNFLFIVGVGRSGTSLLQSMLDSHSSCIFMPETRFLRKYLFKNNRRRIIEKNNVQYFRNILEKDSAFQRIGITPSTILNSRHQQVKKINVLDTYFKIVENYKREENFLGDKDPRNIENIDKVIKYFPYSKIIHLIRDPRDVVLSRTKANWSSHRPWWLHALIYYAQLKTGILSMNKTKNTQLYELKYENLISNSKGELEKLCSFIGIDFEEPMLKFQESSKRLISSEELQWKKETLGKMLNNNFNKWMTELTPSQISFIESICEKFIKKYSYSLSNVNDNLNYFKISFIKLVSLSKYLFYLLYKIKLKANV